MLSLPAAGAEVSPLRAALTLATQRLKPFGVLIRYPGNNATRTQAKKAMADCKTIRRAVRLALRLKV